MSVKLIYQDVAPDAAEDAEVSATGADAISTIDRLPFGTEGGLYATAEHNLWQLDGSVPVYNGETVAFWSAALSDEDGAFETPPVITLETDERYTAPGVSLVFGGDSWCDRVNVSWYQGETLLASEEFTPDGMSYFCERAVEAFDKLVITLNGTSLPHRRAKLDEIIYGLHRTFLRNELRGVSVVEEIDPTSRELAENTLDWTLSSKSAVEYLFQFKQPVYAYDGETLIGVFYIDDSERLADRVYDITCVDAIGVLDNSPFPDAYYSGKNAYELAVEICSGFTVDMAEALREKTVKGVLKGETRRTALQQLCFALGAVADTSGTNAIKIFSLLEGEPVELGPDQLRTGGSVSVDPIATEIRLTAHSYSTTASEGAEEVEIGGVKYYDTKTVTTITNPLATPSDKANVVEVSDATLVSPDNVAVLAQHLYDQTARRKTHSVSFRLDGEMVGDYVQTVTPWGDTLTGHYTRGRITLSGFALSDAEVTVT